jgi:putative zinc finger/helix-turn-helix YgiT family protein
MNSPFTGKDMPLKTRTETMTFRKEPFTIVYHYYHCEATDEEFVTPEMGDLNLNQIYNQYRAKHRVPFPEEIKKTREKYGLPANKMAEVLGFGTNMYRAYESGEIPSESNSRLIILASDPMEFRKLLSLTTTLSEKDREKAQRYVDQLAIEKQASFVRSLEEYVMGDNPPNEYTGYRTPNLDKALQVVIYFAQAVKPWQTSMNKLLFYADFGHYKQTGQSITGLTYRAIRYGVVPQNYDKLFAEAIDQELVEVRYQEFESQVTQDKYVGQQYLPIAEVPFNAELFTETELAVLKRVVELFTGKDTASIVRMNHEETAWQKHIEGHQLVSYQHSFELQHI